MHKKLRLPVAACIVAAVMCLAAYASAQEILVAHPALTFGDIPYYIAKEKGFYRDENIQVKDLYIRGFVTARPLRRARSISPWRWGLACAPLYPGMSIKAIMVYCDKPYHFLYARPDLGVRSAADLKGKRIAVTGLGSTTYYAARKVVERLGLDADKDVRILSVGDIWPAPREEQSRPDSSGRRLPTWRRKWAWCGWLMSAMRSRYRCLDS